MVIFVTFRLPHISSVDTAWDFLEILFEELRCECFYQRDVDENSSSASNVPPSAGVGNGPVPVVQTVKYGVGSSLVGGPGKKRKVSTTSSSSSASEDEEPGIATDAFFCLFANLGLLAYLDPSRGVIQGGDQTQSKVCVSCW